MSRGARLRVPGTQQSDECPFRCACMLHMVTASGIAPSCRGSGRRALLALGHEAWRERLAGAGRRESLPPLDRQGWWSPESTVQRGQHPPRAVSPRALGSLQEEARADGPRHARSTCPRGPVAVDWRAWCHAPHHGKGKLVRPGQQGQQQGPAVSSRPGRGRSLGVQAVACVVRTAGRANQDKCYKC